MMVDPLGSRYPTTESLLQFFDAIEHEIKAVPGVQSVAWASTLPLGESYSGERFFEIVGDPPVDERQRPTADYQIVSPEYFQTLDLPVVAGRAFTDRDRARQRARVHCQRSASSARIFGAASPIGLHVALRSTPPEAKPEVREIVGVARQVKGRPDETEDLMQVYVPLAQDPMDDMFLVVRPESGPAEALAPVGPRRDRSDRQGAARERQRT